MEQVSLVSEVQILLLVLHKTKDLALQGLLLKKSSTFGFQNQVKHVAVLQQDKLFNRIWNLRNAYNIDSESYRFCYVFYDKRDSPDQKVQCPANISEADWKNIGVSCPDPDHLIPYPLLGFDALQERSEKQKAMREDLDKRIKKIQAKLREMTSFYATELQGIFEQIHQNSITIEQTMLDVYKNEEIKNNQGKPITESENNLLKELEAMKFDLDRPGMFHAKIKELREKNEEKLKRVGAHITIDKDSLSKFSLILKSHQDAIEALEKVTKKVAKNLANIEAEMNDQ